MLYLVGLGLHDEKDLSLKGLAILKDSDNIYAEFYTNFFNGNLENIEKLIGKKIEILGREDIEEHPEEKLLKNSIENNTTLLVPGDPMVATTHIDLVLRAKRLGIGVKIVHSSSIYSAISETGLQIYKFGRTTTIPFLEKNYLPMTPYDVLKENLERGLHTLMLLDIKSREKRFMTVNQGIEILMKIEEKRRDNVFHSNRFCIGVARLGGNPTIKAGKAMDLMKQDFGLPPHVLVVPGKLHFMEEEFLSEYIL